MSEEQTALVIQQSPHLMPAMSIDEAVERFTMTTSFVKRIMHEGTDYGTIPGTDKATLLKPGAEKLTTFFGLAPRFELIEGVEDWTGAQHGGEPFFYYWWRCKLSRDERHVAEADGSCNSWEAKYRYRWAERVCPDCKKTSIIKGKEEYGGGWVCWSRRGGCGKKFLDDDQSIIGQQLGRIPNPNPADIVNTINKMAQKRALVAATLLAVNASEFFTQDMEDLDTGVINGEYAVSQDSQPAATKQPTAKQADGNGTNPDNTPTALFVRVNEATTGYYNAVKHMFNSIRVELGEEWGWPDNADNEAWDEAEKAAVAYAEKESA